MNSLRLHTLTILLLASLGNALQSDGAEHLTPGAHHRGGDQTFLTYPEWFLVHSPAEYAHYVQTKPPTRFPFLGHIGQLWTSYRAMYEEVRDKYAFNGEYHTMIMVIGVSTTIEYGLRAAYETLIGRLTELTTAGELTAEDRYGAQIASDYVEFIYETPWYEFDYWGAFAGLWQDTALIGPNQLRKLERKYLLSTEYLIKAGYAKLIKMGARASFDAPAQITMTVMTEPPAALGQPNAQPVPNTDGLWLVPLPRYQPFTEQAQALANAGARFVEVAGNRGDILITTIGDTDWTSQMNSGRILFSQPLLTQPQQRRLGVAVPVAQLHEALIVIDRSATNLEHIYDF
ncbi:MAG: hypothetical protein ACR2PZ_17480 [Pseudomonadales bacterium]